MIKIINKRRLYLSQFKQIEGFVQSSRSWRTTDVYFYLKLDIHESGIILTFGLVIFFLT